MHMPDNLKIKTTADTLVLLDNSGSMLNSVNANARLGIERAMDVFDSGCSWAFVSSNTSQPVILFFTSSPAKGVAVLENDASFQLASDISSIGINPSDFLRLSIEKHISWHGRPPLEIVFLSDFMDMLPSPKFWSSGNGGLTPAVVALSRSRVFCALPPGENGHSLADAQAWADALHHCVGAQCFAMPGEWIASAHERFEIEAAARGPASSSPQPIADKLKSGRAGTAVPNSGAKARTL